MENLTVLQEQLKSLEIQVDGKECRIFERFPHFVPFIGEEYGSGKHKKLLLIWESYYETKSVHEILKDACTWYFAQDKEGEICKLFDDKFETEKEWEPFKNHWNFASKMHAEGIDRKSPTFSNVEKILDEYAGKNSFKFCAGYNYYLRPALNSSSIKSKELDEAVAVETLKKTIDTLKPEYVVFLSKKANTSFKEAGKSFKKEGVTSFEAFVHPASAWWHRRPKPKKEGESLPNGKERFKDFIIKESF